MRLFHGTSRAALERIQEQGHLPSPFLTSCPDQANYYAECSAEDHHGEPCVLVIELDDALLRVDRAAYEEPLTFYRDKWATSDREWYEGLESGDIPSPVDDQDIATALQVTHSLRARTDISADCIIAIVPRASSEQLEPETLESEVNTPCLTM